MYILPQFKKKCLSVKDCHLVPGDSGICLKADMQDLFMSDPQLVILRVDLSLASAKNEGCESTERAEMHHKNMKND